MACKVKFEVVPLTEVSTEDTKMSFESFDERRPAVLVVDDERVIADTLAIILSKKGFSTMTAYEGFSALELARRHRPDLIISDVMMPGMTGVELAIAVTQTVPGCRILLFSGQAATVDLLEKARDAGFDFATMTKPVHPTDMLKRISECLGTRERLSASAMKSPSGGYLYQ
jgi:CheY-like chemotaxis protein